MMIRIESCEWHMAEATVLRMRRGVSGDSTPDKLTTAARATIIQIA
jgi:hypothetical protein